MVGILSRVAIGVCDADRDVAEIRPARYRAAAMSTLTGGHPLCV